MTPSTEVEFGRLASDPQRGCGAPPHRLLGLQEEQAGSECIISHYLWKWLQRHWSPPGLALWGLNAFPVGLRVGLMGFGREALGRIRAI